MRKHSIIAKIPKEILLQHLGNKLETCQREGHPLGHRSHFLTSE